MLHMKNNHSRRASSMRALSVTCLLGAMCAVTPKAIAQELRPMSDLGITVTKADSAYVDQFTGAWEGPELINGIPRGFKLIDGDILVPDTYDRTASLAPTKWSGGIVYFQFDANVSAGNRLAMLAAMDSWNNSNANVVFLPRFGQTYYVHIVAANSNSSPVGRSRGGQIKIYNWNYRFIMAHELAHTLGFWHEQSRPDRDTYVEIITSNIQTDYVHNFNKQSSWLTLGTPYDFYSVMHYGQRAFSTCTDFFCFGICPCIWCSPHKGATIITRPGYSAYNGEYGQRSYLSGYDVLDMAAVYGNGNHPKFVDRTNTSTQHGTLQYPYAMFPPAGMSVMGGSTVWIRGGNYVGVGTYSRRSTWKPYPGSGEVHLR